MKTIRRKYSLIANHEADAEGYLVRTGARSADEKTRTLKSVWVSWPRGTFIDTSKSEVRSIIERAVRATEDGGENMVYDKFDPEQKAWAESWRARQAA